MKATNILCFVALCTIAPIYAYYSWDGGIERLQSVLQLVLAAEERLKWIVTEISDLFEELTKSSEEGAKTGAARQFYYFRYEMLKWRNARLDASMVTPEQMLYDLSRSIKTKNENITIKLADTADDWMNKVEQKVNNFANSTLQRVRKAAFHQSGKPKDLKVKIEGLVKQLVQLSRNSSEVVQKFIKSEHGVFLRSIEEL